MCKKRGAECQLFRVFSSPAKLVGKGEDVVNNDGNTEVMNEDSELPPDSFVPYSKEQNDEEPPNLPLGHEMLRILVPSFFKDKQS